MASPDMIGYPLFILLDHHFLNFSFLFFLQSVESSTVERRGDYDRTSRSDFRDGADDGEERRECWLQSRGCSPSAACCGLLLPVSHSIA